MREIHVSCVEVLQVNVTQKDILCLARLFLHDVALFSYFILFFDTRKEDCGTGVLLM